MLIENFCRRCAANYEAGNDQPCARCQGLGITWKVVPELDYLRQSLAAAQSRIDDLERMVVWAVRHGANAGYDGDSHPAVWYEVDSSRMTRWGIPVTSVEYDGTPAGILAAVKEAMGDAAK